MDVQIRRAMADDASAVASILKRAFAEYRSLYTDGGFAATTPAADGVLVRMQEGPVWVATCDRDVVGTTSVVHTDRGLYIRGMAVIPEARGLGAGRALLHQISAHAASSGYDKLLLSTTPFLDSAIRLYEAYGFERTGRAADLFGTPLITMEAMTRRTVLRAAISTSFADKARSTTRRELSWRDGEIEIVHARVFATGPGGGNPCPVVPEADRLSDFQMRKLAQRFGLDTAFILKPQVPGADLRLRYFVPDHEMGISGHATIAAVTVALRSKRIQSHRLRIQTITGVFAVEAIRRGDEISITLEQNQPEFGPAVSADEVARALRMDTRDLDASIASIQPVSVSRAKLIVPVRDCKVLNALQPDFGALWTLCDRLHVTGFYPFTRNTDKPGADVEARQFPLRAGFPEDAATGVAAGALGAYLAAHDRKCEPGPYCFRVAQGFAMGAGSLIEAIGECAGGRVVRTAIRGTAQIICRDHIPVPAAIGSYLDGALFRSMQ